MKRLIPAGILLLTVAAAHAAGPKPDMQAQMQEMQAAQAKMMAAMMTEAKSRLGFDETVAALQEAAKKNGWQVGQVMDMQEVMRKGGHKDARPFKVLAMCKQDLAEDLLKTQAAHRVMPFVPCRISVFEAADGKVYVAKPNTEMMAQTALPPFAPLLKKFVKEEQAVLAGIVE